MTLLPFSEEGMSRRGAARRLLTDGSWRAGTGLSWQDRTPAESELRRFERFLRGRDEATGVRRLFLWLGHIVDVCRQIEVVNRPVAGFATRRPEEPYANSARTVL